MNVANKTTYSENSPGISHNYPLRDKNYSGFTSLWVLLLPSLFSVSPNLQKRPFGNVLAQPCWPLSFGSHAWAPSALIQHHRPRRSDVRADRCHHLSIRYHHQLLPCSGNIKSPRMQILKFTAISQRQLLKISENSFRKVSKTLERS